MNTTLDYIAFLGGYCVNCCFLPYCQEDGEPCTGRMMNDIGIDMILRGDYW